MIRKFYDAAVADAGASTKFEVTREEVSLNDVFEGMRPENKVEKKEEIVEEKKEAAAEVKVEAKVEGAAAAEVKVEPKQEVATPDWKELVKKQDRKEVFALLEIDEDALSLSKELKQDEFVNKIVTYRKENGNVTPFIEAATKDWDKVSHLDLLRDDLKRQYPKLSDERFSILSKNNIDKRFILGEDAPEDEAEVASVLLETEGEKIREARKAEQKQFLDSVKPVDKTAETQRLAKEQEAAAQKELEQFSEMIEANPFFTKLNTDKKISFGSKEHAFNHPANPESVKEQAIASRKFFDKFWSEDKSGNPVFDVERWSKVMTYAENPLSFEDALIVHGKSLGTGKVVEELENTTVKTTQQSQQVKKTLAKTFVEEGKPITLQELYGGGGN